MKQQFQQWQMKVTGKITTDEVTRKAKYNVIETNNNRWETIGTIITDETTKTTTEELTDEVTWTTINRWEGTNYKSIAK